MLKLRLELPHIWCTLPVTCVMRYSMVSSGIEQIWQYRFLCYRTIFQTCSFWVNECKIPHLEYVRLLHHYANSNIDVGVVLIHFFSGYYCLILLKPNLISWKIKSTTTLANAVLSVTERGEGGCSFRSSKLSLVLAISPYLTPRLISN